MDRSKDAETILQYLGVGRWQIMVYILHAGIFASFGIQFSAYPYYVDTPPHHCKIPANSTFNETIPAQWKDGQVVGFDSCKEYVNSSHSNVTRQCSNGYWFDPEYGYESTVTTDFEMVCDKAIIIEHTMMIRSVTQVVMAVIGSYLSDRFGRKKVLMIACFFRPICAIVDSFMPNFFAKLVVATISDLLQVGLSSAFILALEMFPSDRRAAPGGILEVMWAVGMICFTPFFYFIRNWRVLERAVSIPSFIFYVIVFAPESITWLVRVGRYEEIKRIVKQACRVNKKEVHPELAALLERRIAECKALEGKGEKEALAFNSSEDKVASKEKTFKYSDIFRHPQIRRCVLIQIYVWCVNNLVYGALAITMPYVPGDRYTNFVYFGLAEIAAASLHSVGVVRFGRRIPMFLFHLVAGVGLMVTIVEAFKESLNFNWLPLVIAATMIGKLGITASYMTIYLYTPETFPTQIRGKAVGICGAVSSVAAFVVPYSRVLERHQPGLMRGICGGLSIIAAFLVLALPETHNRPLPETIEDMKNQHSPKKPNGNLISTPLHEKHIVSETMSSL